MSKYRRLSLSELQSLEKEFINFLVVQGITADDWVNISSSEPQKSEQIIDNFSDMVFDNVFQSTLFIVLREKQTLRVFHAQQDCLVERGLYVNAEDADFTDVLWCSALLENPPANLQKYHRSTPYVNRKKDLFLLTESGGLISDSKLYALLEALD